MEAAEENIICPYPGLRPFREDESIFLRGRDEHVDQITRQLEQKKFLMLTGASGDGKSSLVYAGLIPNARAGFFKAKFNNWQVVDFRPERAPLQNLEDALAARFSGDVRERFRRELKFGFSSLIDIYTDSPHYIDKSKPEFTSLSEADQRKAMRKGSNLLILVDQFEEFFTNSENYFEGRSSADSQLVVSMLLETCRIATERDLPVYVVCTMRSDYIGQCASFRGLPEAIGYSQFFVPRLKRKEIYQVIEEPAQLNGNTISKRLVEMLLHQMGEGIDQLPVLQHALNQIWHEAGKGAEEMDLIHFARVGGVDAAYLPEADKESFSEWKAALPEHRRPFFENPNLDNVLDRHANDLYHEAHTYFLERHPGHALTHEQAREIIETAFRSLTKIDASRSVRNRMTLHEIVHLLHQPQLGLAEVSGVLEIFRLPGNTFLQPFYEAGEASPQEQAAWVMDITHESLIRNWGKLIEWSHAEEQDHQTWLDFAKQLNRWVDNGKTSGYLLPIGPLNFFEGWFEKKQPNEYWLMKYDERDVSADEKLKDAQVTLINARRFIRASIGKLFFSRFVLKHGAQRVALWACMAVLLFFCEYFRRDYSSKTNESVVRDAENRGIELLTSARVNPAEKARFLINYESLHPGSMESMLRRCGGDSVQLLVIKNLTTIILPENYQNFNLAPNHLEETSRIFNRILGNYVRQQIELRKSMVDSSDLSLDIRLCNAGLLLHSCINRMESHKDELQPCLDSLSQVIWQYVFWNPALEQRPQDPGLMLAASELLMSNQFPKDSLKQFLEKISPLHDAGNAEYFQRCFPKNKALPYALDPTYGLLLKGAGAYEFLAQIYAYQNDSRNCLRSLDSLLVLDPEFPKRTFWAGHDFLSIGSFSWIVHEGEDQPATFTELLKFMNSKMPADEMITARTFQFRLFDFFNSNGDARTEFLKANHQVSNLGMVFKSLFGKRSQQILDAAEAQILVEEKNFEARHYEQAILCKSRIQFAMLMRDTTLADSCLREFYLHTQNCTELFLSGEIEIKEAEKLRTSRALHLFHPGILSSNWGGYNGTINSERSGGNYFFTSVIRSQLFQNYNWSEGDLVKMTSWLYASRLQDRPFNMDNRLQYYDAENIWLLAGFVADRLKGNAKNEELILCKSILDCLHPDSLGATSGMPFLNVALEDSVIKALYAQTDLEPLTFRRCLGFHYLVRAMKSRPMADVFKLIDNNPNAMDKRNLLLKLAERAFQLGLNEQAISLFGKYADAFDSTTRPCGLFFYLAARVGSKSVLSWAESIYRDSREDKKLAFNDFLAAGHSRCYDYQLSLQRMLPGFSSAAELGLLNHILSEEKQRIAPKSIFTYDRFAWGVNFVMFEKAPGDDYIVANNSEE